MVTLVVEDGTGLANANSYLSVADATDYHASRGNETWTDADDSERATALVRATFAIDNWLRGRWKGTKLTTTQRLAWPRADATNEEGADLAEDAVPLEVLDATAEVALIELSERFIQQSVSKDNSIASESVGPIAVSYRQDAPTIKYYPHVEAMLRGVAAVGGTQLNFAISLTQEEQEYLDNQGMFDPFDYPEYFELIKWG